MVTAACADCAVESRHPDRHKYQRGHADGRRHAAGISPTLKRSIKARKKIAGWDPDYLDAILASLPA
jgi:ribosome assembly protein YihI (activator of Der GTPase)